jgi:ABC-type branched-subunit amino acid transport system ATPase component
MNATTVAVDFGRALAMKPRVRLLDELMGGMNRPASSAPHLAQR